MHACKQDFFPRAFSAVDVKLDVHCPEGQGMNPVAEEYFSLIFSPQFFILPSRQ
jgi:hypothetical protein